MRTPTGNNLEMEDSVDCGLGFRHHGTEPATNPRTNEPEMLVVGKECFLDLANVPKRLTKESGIWGEMEIAPGCCRADKHPEIALGSETGQLKTPQRGLGRSWILYLPAT